MTVHCGVCETPMDNREEWLCDECQAELVEMHPDDGGA